MPSPEEERPLRLLTENENLVAKEAVELDVGSRKVIGVL